MISKKTKKTKMKTNKDLMKCIALIFTIALLTFLESTNISGQVKMSEQAWTLPTYEVAPPDKNPVFVKSESYQGASKYIYPLGINDIISDHKVDKAWKALLLENEYIK